MPRLFRHFSLFIIFSLFLHGGVLYYLLTRAKETITPSLARTPFFVDLREPKEKPRELDIPIQPQLTPRTQLGRRLAEKEQEVIREAAPKGSDSRDSVQKPLPPHPPPDTERSTEEAAPVVKPDGTIPSLTEETLLTATKNAARRIADLDPEVKRKMREDVEEGRAIWLDTEKDILGSFYKRFRSAVENVWDYPKDAVARGEAGVCLYRIEINRAGVLVNEPELLESSGFDRLDAEAKKAVLKASPLFGFLPEAYRYETLTIFAYFDYRLGNRPRVQDVYYYR